MNFPDYEQQTNAMIVVITVCTVIAAAVFIWAMAVPS